MEVQQISNMSKEELIKYFTDNGFTYDAGSDKFTKHETINAGKLIMNGKEIYKTQEVSIDVEYIYTGSIDDDKSSILAHQLKLNLNGTEIEFLVTDKYDLNDFFGLDVGDIPDRSQMKSNVKYVEDIVC